MNVVAATEVRPDKEPPVIFTLFAFWVDMVPRPVTSVLVILNRDLTCVVVRAIGVAALPVLFPIMELAARLAIFPRVTTPLAMVVDKLP